MQPTLDIDISDMSLKCQMDYLKTEIKKYSEQVSRLNGYLTDVNMYSKGIDLGNTGAKKEKKKIDIQLNFLKNELRRICAMEDNIKRDIIKEALGDELYMEAMDEVNRRLNGETPMKISFKASIASHDKQKESTDKYKKLSRQLLSKLMNARKALTNCIMAGCEKYDRGEFMKLISEANNTLEPLAELNKIERINNL